MFRLAFRGEISLKKTTSQITGGGELQGMGGGFIITMKGRFLYAERADWLAEEAGTAWRNVKRVNYCTILAGGLAGLDSHANSPYPI